MAAIVTWQMRVTVACLVTVVVQILAALEVKRLELASQGLTYCCHKVR